MAEQTLGEICRQMALDAKLAAQQIQQLTGEAKNRWLHGCAESLRSQAEDLVTANKLDLEAAPGYGLTEAAIDRLVLDKPRIHGIADSLNEIASLNDPVGETISGSIRPNGLQLRKVRVPLGTVFFIYESRPNVTADAAAICLKSGNSVILRGGKEAKFSSRFIVQLMCEQASLAGISPAAVQLVESTDRAAVGHFLKMHDCIDVAIPRGGRGLIERVANEATMPVIKHFDGNCHVYIDEHADIEMAVKIVVNSKCQRMGVCNACESLVVHESIAAKFLPIFAAEMARRGVEIRGDETVCESVPQAVPATDEDWGMEYLGPQISACVVPGLQDAIAHINRYSSKHTEAIVTSNLHAAERFQLEIDSSAVTVNASTRFNDGGEFGLGAEIGISTDKFHARGPCGLRELTTTKYLVNGQGQTR